MSSSDAQKGGRESAPRLNQLKTVSARLRALPTLKRASENPDEIESTLQTWSNPDEIPLVRNSQLAEKCQKRAPLPSWKSVCLKSPQKPENNTITYPSQNSSNMPKTMLLGPDTSRKTSKITKTVSFCEI